MNKQLVGTIVGLTATAIGSALAGIGGTNLYNKKKKQEVQLDEVAATETTQEETTKL